MITLSLTPTARQWLVDQIPELNAAGIADVIEKLARQYDPVPELHSGDRDVVFNRAA